MASQELTGATQLVFRSRDIILQQLERQGYQVEEYEDFTVAEVHALMQSKQLDMLVDRKSDGRKVYVKYHLSKTMRPNNVTEYVDDLFTLENVLSRQDTLVIVSKDEPNDTLTQQVKQLWETEGIFVVIYPVKRLQFDILQHEKVPPHEILSLEEKDKFMKKYGVTSHLQIPEISRFDPVSLAIGIRAG